MRFGITENQPKALLKTIKNKNFGGKIMSTQVEFKGRTLAQDYADLLKWEYGEALANKLMDSKNPIVEVNEEIARINNDKNIVDKEFEAKKLIKMVSICHASPDVEYKANHLCKKSMEENRKNVIGVDSLTKEDVRQEAVCLIMKFISELSIINNCLMQKGNIMQVNDLRAYVNSDPIKKLIDYHKKSQGNGMSDRQIRIKANIRKSYVQQDIIFETHDKRVDYVISITESKSYPNITEKEVLEIMNFGESSDSLDKPYSSEDDSFTLGDTIGNNNPSIEDIAIGNADIEIVQKNLPIILRNLAKKNAPKYKDKGLSEEQVFEYYNDVVKTIMYEEDCTIKNLAEARGISTNSISRTKKILLKELREALEEEYLAI